MVVDFACDNPRAMDPLATAFPDPRDFAQPAPSAEAAEVYRLCEERLASASDVGARVLDTALRERLAHAIAHDDPGLVPMLAAAPSIDVARQLHRQLDAGWRQAAADEGALLQLFAVPVVIVAGAETASAEGVLSGVVDPAPLVQAMTDGGALAGNRQFAMAGALLAPSALEPGRLGAWASYRRQRLAEAASDGGLAGEHALPGIAAPMAVAPGPEAVHLRFLAGTAVAAPAAELFDQPTLERWGMAFTRTLSAQLARPGRSVLALPRAPQTPPVAWQQGLTAQREIGAQLFVGNALRRLRAATGEPTAIVSAHRTSEAPGGGELRVSLSSPFEPRDAEGFRCPIHPFERVGDALAMLVTLLRDCRVADVRLVAGVHPDRVTGSTQPLLFKPETLPGEAALLQ